MLETFIEVFDEGGPISSTAALIATVDLETRDIGAHDLPAGMADRMLEVHWETGGHPDDVLVRFCEGTAFLDADSVLSMVLEFDRFRFVDHETPPPSGAGVPAVETSGVEAPYEQAMPGPSAWYADLSFMVWMVCGHHGPVDQ